MWIVYLVLALAAIGGLGAAITQVKVEAATLETARLLRSRDRH